MARKKDKTQTSAKQPDLPIFTASSVLFKQWLEEEVKKRTQKHSNDDEQRIEQAHDEPKEASP